MIFPELQEVALGHADCVVNSSFTFVAPFQPTLVNPMADRFAAAPQHLSQINLSETVANPPTREA